MDKHDQEMHMTGNAQKEHELTFRRWKPKYQQTPETSRNYLNWPLTRRFDK